MKINWTKPLSFLLALCLIAGLCPSMAVPADAAADVDPDSMAAAADEVGDDTDPAEGDDDTDPAEGDDNAIPAADDAAKEVQIGGVVYSYDGYYGYQYGSPYLHHVRPVRVADESVTEVTLPRTITFTTTEGGEKKLWEDIRVVVPDGDLPKNSPSLKILDISQMDYLTEQTFQDCTNLTKVILPPQAAEIPWGFFQGCTGLTEVVFPENLTSLGSGCFQGCTSLKSIDLPDSLTTLPFGCFSDCAGLTGIRIPDSVTTIGWNCFDGCTSLTSVVLPKSLTEIPDGCFMECTSLTAISIPDTVTVVGVNAFKNSGLTGITLPEGLKTLQEACFYGTSITDLKIPAGVTTLYAMFAPYGPGGTPQAAEGLQITFMGDLSGIDAPEKALTIPDRVTVFVQPGTEKPDWLKWNNVETVGAVIPPYRLEVTNSKDGQLDLGDFTISNGSFGRGLFISFKNTGTEALSGLKVEVKTSTPHGRVGTLVRTELKPNEGATIEFFPNTDLKSGTYTDDLTITTDQQVTISLKVKFSITAITCLTVTPETLDFGTAYVGAAQPAAQTLTITAGDHAVDLKINQPEHFTCTVGKTQLAKGESTTVTVQPKAELAAGTYKERIGFSCSEHSGGRGVELQFTVKAKPNFTFSVTEMDFGQGKQGFTPQAQVVNVTNTGSTATITKATLSGDGFEYSRRLAGSYEISGGTTIEEIVGIRPKEGLDDGTYTGALVFEIEDGTTYTIPLKYVVNGVSTLSASPNRLEFGSVTEGNYTQPAAQTVTLTNTGKSPVTLKTPTSTNYDVGAFSRTTLAAGETATFTVRPKAGLAARGYADTLTVNTAQGDIAVVFLSFKVDGALSASPNRLDFGTVKENYTQPDPQTVTVTNAGKSQVTLEAPASTNYVLGALSRTTLAAGETATFTVRPKAELKEGTYSEQIVIKTEQGGSATVTVNFKVDGAGTLSASPDRLDFGSLKEGYSQPDAKTVTLTNSGKEQVTLEAPTSANYVLGALSRTTLAAGETATFTVRPKAELKEGSYSEQIVIKTEQGGSAAVAVSFKVEKKGPTFTDVKESDWFYEDVEYAYEKGLMNGVGNNRFDPTGTTTRGQIVTILYRLEGEPTVSGRSAFPDVFSGDYYANAVKWASDHQIVNGYSNGRFGPNDPITREQMAAILYRYAGYKHYNVSARADLSKFTDAGSVSGYAVDAISWANSQGLINGTSGSRLDPRGSAIRAQAAAILHRFCENIA